MKFKNQVTFAVWRSKVCSVWGLWEICFSLRRNQALSVLAIAVLCILHGKVEHFDIDCSKRNEFHLCLISA